MSCQNCKTFHNLCKARCCAFAPLPRTTYFGNFDKQQRPVEKVMELEGDNIVPVTEDGYCTFLTDTLECAIYDQKPEICDKFGDESHINMTCSFQTKDGQSRSKKERRRIDELQQQTLKQFITNI